MDEERFDSLMEKARHDGSLKVDEYPTKLESDNDSSECIICAPTTFKMLLEKTQVSGSEFLECCQQIGIIATTASCPKCTNSMVLVDVDEESWDGVEWQCSACSENKNVRAKSWFEDIQEASLKEIILILYFWSRDYPEVLCKHEMECNGSASVIPIIYKKCFKLAEEYFNHPISCIGGSGVVVQIEKFSTSKGLHVIGGVERDNIKNIFFRFLPENWTRDHLATILADSLNSGTFVHFQNKILLEILGDMGLKYLDTVWGLGIETSSEPINSVWERYDKLFKEKEISQKDITETLFRRRMECSKDPFLFLLGVISTIHPLS